MMKIKAENAKIIQHDHFLNTRFKKLKDFYTLNY